MKNYKIQRFVAATHHPQKRSFSGSNEKGKRRRCFSVLATTHGERSSSFCASTYKFYWKSRNLKNK